MLIGDYHLKWENIVFEADILRHPKLSLTKA
jgi:hypothetical protein